MNINKKFNIPGTEGRGVKVIERIRLNAYDEVLGYTVKPDSKGRHFRVKLLPAGKFYKNAPTVKSLSGRIGICGGVEHASADVILPLL